MSEARAEKFLSLLVDDKIVKAVFIIKLEEGVVAYWPPEALDDEARSISEALSVPLNPGLYFIIGGNDLLTKYAGLVAGENILLFRVCYEAPAEVLAEGLSRAYNLFVKRRLADRNVLGEEYSG